MVSHLPFLWVCVRLEVYIKSRSLCILCSGVGCQNFGGEMPHHILQTDRSSLHGMFSAELTPALRVSLGDTVEFRDVLDVAWGCGQHDRVAQTRDKWGPRVSPGDDGIALHGPIFIEGLMPGDTLAISIQQIRVGSYGWTLAGDGPFNAALNRALGMEEGLNELMLWALDADADWAESEQGYRAPIRPFPGTIGLCPGGDGPHQSWFPTRTGGNMDARHVQEGTILYLPVEVEGGLLSLGDGHAAQGDGELSGTAIECMLERIVLGLSRADDFAAPGPVVQYPDDDGRWVAMGFGEAIDDAIAMAAHSILSVICHVLSCERAEALLLASTFVDIQITQLVNGVKGAHAVFRPPQRVEAAG